MATKRYPLEPGGPERVELTWAWPRRNTTVAVDGQVLGTMATVADLRKGGSFALADGSTVEVRLGGFPNELRVTRDGVPLPGSPSDPRSRVRSAAYVLWAIAGLSALVGLLTELGGSETLRAMGLGWPAVIEAGLFAILGFLVLRGSLVALIVAIVIYAVDTLFLLVSISRGVPTSGLFLRVFLAVILVQAVPAARQLRAERAAVPPV